RLCYVQQHVHRLWRLLLGHEEYGLSTKRGGALIPACKYLFENRFRAIRVHLKKRIEGSDALVVVFVDALGRGCTARGGTARSSSGSLSRDTRGTRGVALLRELSTYTRSERCGVAASAKVREALLQASKNAVRRTHRRGAAGTIVSEGLVVHRVRKQGRLRVAYTDFVEQLCRAIIVASGERIASTAIQRVSGIGGRRTDDRGYNETAGERIMRRSNCRVCLWRRNRERSYD